MSNIKNIATRGQVTTIDPSTKRPVMRVVDDGPLYCAHVNLFFYSADSFQVLESCGCREVDLNILPEANVVALDLNMPDEDGIEFMHTLAALQPKPKLLIASGYEQAVIDMAVRTAKLYGMTATIGLQKPIDRKIFTHTAAELCSQNIAKKPTVPAQTGLRGNCVFR